MTKRNTRDRPPSQFHERLPYISHQQWMSKQTIFRVTPVIYRYRPAIPLSREIPVHVAPTVGVSTLYSSKAAFRGWVSIDGDICVNNYDMSLVFTVLEWRKIRLSIDISFISVPYGFLLERHQNTLILSGIVRLSYSSKAAFRGWVSIDDHISANNCDMSLVLAVMKW